MITAIGIWGCDMAPASGGAAQTNRWFPYGDAPYFDSMPFNKEIVNIGGFVATPTRLMVPSPGIYLAQFKADAIGINCAHTRMGPRISGSDNFSSGSAYIWHGTVEWDHVADAGVYISTDPPLEVTAIGALPGDGGFIEVENVVAAYDPATRDATQFVYQRPILQVVRLADLPDNPHGWPWE